MQDFRNLKVWQKSLDRAGDRDFRRFIRIALGSASELEYHLLLARDLGILPDASYEPLAGQVAEVKANAQWSCRAAQL